MLTVSSTSQTTIAVSNAQQTVFILKYLHGPTSSVLWHC